jgi:hypothetical protein
LFVFAYIYICVCVCVCVGGLGQLMQCNLAGRVCVHVLMYSRASVYV